MSALSPTSKERLLDARGRPYFLWDEDTTLEEFLHGLKDPDPEIRAYRAGKLMRQAKPDDVLAFLTLAEIRELWPRLERYLGRSRPFWEWVLAVWPEASHGCR